MTLGLAYRVEPELNERAAEREAEEFSSKLDEEINSIDPLESEDMFSDDITEQMVELQELTEEFGEFSLEGIQDPSSFAADIAYGEGPAQQEQEGGVIGDILSETFAASFAEGIFGGNEPMPVEDVSADGGGGPVQTLAMGALLKDLVQEPLGDQLSDVGGILASVKGSTQKAATATTTLGALFTAGIAGIVVGGLALGFLSSITKSLAQQSPYLESVLGIFGMAMSLFFRPFGDILAGLLLPIGVALLNLAAGFYSTFSEDGLIAAFGYLFDRLIGALFTLDGMFVAAFTTAATAIGAILGAKVGALVAAKTGAALGAAVGSIIPGGGTLLGGAIGGTLGLIVGLLAALITVFNVDLQEKLDGIMEPLVLFLRPIAEFLESAKNFIIRQYVKFLELKAQLKTYLGNKLGPILEYIKELYATFQEGGLGALFQKLFEDSGVGEVFENVLPSGVLSAYESLKEFIEGDFDFAEVVNDVFEEARDSASELAGDTRDAVETELEDLSEWVANSWSFDTDLQSVFDRGLSFAQDITENIRTSVEDRLSGLASWTANRWSFDTDIQDVFDSALSFADSIAQDIREEVQSRLNALQTWVKNRWPIDTDLRDIFERARNFIQQKARDIYNQVRAEFRNLRNFFVSVWDLVPLSDTFEAIFTKIVGGDAAIIPTLRSDIESVLNGLRSWLGNTWNLIPFTNVFENAKSDIVGGSGIIPSLISSIKSGLNSLNNWLENTFGVDVESAFDNAFNSAVDAVDNAFSRLDFSVLGNALNNFGSEVEELIGSLNELAGVNIDVDVPDFDALLDEAIDIVSARFSGGGGGGNGSDGSDGSDGTDGGPTGSCFTGDELVLTSDGYVKIMNLKEGMRVVSYDEYTGHMTESVIGETIVHDKEKHRLLQVVFMHSDGDITLTKVTPEHLYLHESGEWKPIGEISLDDSVIASDGEARLVDKFEISPANVVYNLHMKEGPNNYTVNDTVVHNAKMQTGGLVGSTGRVTIHENERVLPEAQVSERGEADLSQEMISVIESMVGTNSTESPMTRVQQTLDNSSRIENVVEMDNDGGVDERSLERAFERAIDRIEIDTDNAQLEQEVTRVRREIRKLREEMDLKVEFKDNSKWEVNQ